MSIATIASSLRRVMGALLLVGNAAHAETRSEPEDVPLSAEQVAIANEAMRLIESSPHSADRRLRVLDGIGLNADGLAVPMKTLTPIEDLVEQSHGSTDPMVLVLLAGACGVEKPPCDAVDLARCWTVADTQNPLAWLTLSSALRRRGDIDGPRNAFVRAAAASTWHEYYDEGTRTVLRALPQSMTPGARIQVLQNAWALSGGGYFRTMHDTCSRRPARTLRCESLMPFFSTRSPVANGR